MVACVTSQTVVHRLHCLVCLRRVPGLVGSRPLVAREELLVAKDAFYAGPVRSTGGRQARIHDDAQEPPCCSSRPSRRRRAGQFLVGPFHRRHKTLQGIRSVSHSFTLRLSQLTTF